MLDRIIKFSIDNRLLVLAISFMILAAGLVTLFQTEVDIFPDLNAPTVVVMTEAGGMAPEEVEQLVTFPVETAVNGSPGVRRVRSSSSTGFSVVWVEFDWNTDISEARRIVAEKLPALQSELPSGVGVPTLGPPSSILGEIMIIGLTSDSESPGELRSIADRQLRPRLLAVSGVSSVSVIGGDIHEYRIELSPEKMRHYGLTLNEILETLENFNANVSGGIINDYDNEYLVKATLSTSDVDELGSVYVGEQEGRSILLSDIAEIGLAPRLPRLGSASLNSQEAVLLTVTKQPGTGSISLTERLLKEIKDLKASLPGDIQINTEIFRQSDFIENSVSNLQGSLFEGAIFVIIVLMVFLTNFRTTLISALAIPMSVIITLLIIHWLGFTVNTMTLGGIAIAIGSLVDDAIVDVENVYRRLRLNRQLPADRRADVETIVFEASREVRMPILNSSLIIIASFLPLFFLHGMEGRMLIPLGISFVIALLASTVVALTLTPVLCLFLLGAGSQERKMEKEPYVSRHIGAFYEKLLEKTLKSPYPLFGAVLLLVAGASVIFPFLGRSFLPPFNEGSFTVNVSALPGVSLELSDSIGNRAELLLREVPEVKLTARKTGRAELDEHSLGSNVSEIEVPYSLHTGRTREEVTTDIRQRLSTLPGVMVEIGQPISHRIDAMLSGTEAQIALKIFGPDLDRLYSLGTQIKGLMEQTEGLTDINVEQQTPRPQIDIRPRREMMSAYGISLPDFRRFVDVALAGLPVSQVYEGNTPYDITLRLSDENRNSIDGLVDLMIDSKEGPIPLGYVADIISTSGPNTVNRENVSRRLVVSANVEGRDLRGAVNDLRDKVSDKLKLPEGYSIAYGGQFESEESASRTLLLTSLGAILLIFFLLYAEFNSVTESLVILVNMPLAMTGGVLILWLTGRDINIPAIIGFISLLGISTRNGMLLMSRYNHMRHEKNELAERVLKGSRERLNPILMTGLSSALALIPLALRSSQPGNEIQAPMAIVILGGLITSTFLNIFVVPVLYNLLCRKGAIPDSCDCKVCKNKKL